MLKLENITKIYETGDLRVEALKDLSLEFRKSEFVSILGPSGCGKTTLLNIVGGLDRYTEGDIIINGKSTKEYKDKDWDTYRNHSVGFVFQSYNLIPHQTVLENVELALTLSGVSKEERRQRATDVLTKVGLRDKLKSKPNQLSGGQMQRVAIARALVNDPEIILADEPTGALDTVSSIQVMELLKEIANDRLIIMVTHNPELAEKYSTRIVKLLDGKLIDDSAPYKSRKRKVKPIETSKGPTDKKKKNKKSKGPVKKKMSFFTALALSFKNLLTKKTRTLLVSFAGSIGIIGIALILAISSGFSTYINKMQEDTLSTYPITISAKSVDFTSVVTYMFAHQAASDKTNHELDAVYPKENITNLLDSIGNSMGTNNLKEFKSYIDKNYDTIKEYVNDIQYTYDIPLEFYTETGSNVQPNSNALMSMITKYSLYYFEEKTNITWQANPTVDTVTKQPTVEYIFKKTDTTNYKFMEQYPETMYIKDELEDPANNGQTTLSSIEVLSLVFNIMEVEMDMSAMGSSGSMFGSMNIFYEMMNNSDLIKSQYDLLGQNSRLATKANEAVLVLDKNNELDDYVLYGLGLITDQQMNKIMEDLVHGQVSNNKIDYDKVIGTKYKVLTESDYFVDIAGTLTDIRLYNTQFINKQPNPDYDPETYYDYYSQQFTKCTNEVEIVGILRLNETTDAGCLSTGVAYTKNLTTDMINYHKESAYVQANPTKEISLDNPATINIYVNTFESKDAIKDFIIKYNAQADTDNQITYTDYIDLIMSTVSVIINAITYVLIAFVGVSLVVSSIMIGIITYISVIERTKEIGVLRSVGASKRDIKRVFTAESFIIGLSSGAFGILITLILILPINLLLKHFTGIGGLASLPVLGAIILIAISIILTLIAGLIPANLAAKKDPVVALRSN